jgi:hypothetical protein
MVPEYKTHPSPRHDSAVCSAFHRPRRRVVPPTLPDCSAFHPHSGTIPFRLTSNGCIEGEPGDLLHQHPQREARRAHLQYSTSVFRPLSNRKLFTDSSVRVGIRHSEVEAKLWFGNAKKLATSARQLRRTPVFTAWIRVPVAVAARGSDVRAPAGCRRYHRAVHRL